MKVKVSNINIKLSKVDTTTAERLEKAMEHIWEMGMTSLVQYVFDGKNTEGSVITDSVFISPLLFGDNTGTLKKANMRISGKDFVELPKGVNEASITNTEMKLTLDDEISTYVLNFNKIFDKLSRLGSITEATNILLLFEYKDICKIVCEPKMGGNFKKDENLF